jgi:hypothetical protein
MGGAIGHPTNPRLQMWARSLIAASMRRALAAALCTMMSSCSPSTLPPKPPKRERIATWVCAPGGPERCSDARDNNCNGLADEGCGIGSGLVQVLIAWSDDTDVDLEVTDPKGSQARTGAVSSSGLIKDRDCPGRDERRCRGVNTENVVLAANRELESGEYVVVVRLAPHQEPKAPVVVNISGRLGARTLAATVTLTPSEPQRVFVWSL